VALMLMPPVKPTLPSTISILRWSRLLSFQPSPPALAGLTGLNSIRWMPASRMRLKNSAGTPMVPTLSYRILTVTPCCCFSISASANFRPSSSWSKI
jgi:hypothetical protein